jgi:sterol desaturase/sphingolipid hydroxylase (fatty acid hydroxylase superfamily)
MYDVFDNAPEVLKAADQVLLAFGALFIVLIAVELAYDYFSKNSKRRFVQSFVDLGVYIGHELAIRFGGSLVFLGALTFAARFRFFELPINLWTWIGGLTLADFLYYWSHRLEHTCRLFWSWHNVHHSSTDYNGTTALRLAWLEPFVSWYLLVPMVLVGFHPLHVLILFQVLLTYQTWIHTQKIGKLGRFEAIFNTPSSHRVHHGSNPKYLDKNFGAVFIVWDRLFGTYEPEVEPVKYGLTQDINTNNPLQVNLHAPAKLIRELFKAQSIGGYFRWLLGAPK